MTNKDDLMDPGAYDVFAAKAVSEYRSPQRWRSARSLRKIPVDRSDPLITNLTVSLDAVRSELEIDATENQGEVIQAAREKCREHLRAGRNFAFNATNITHSTRARRISLFADYQARIEIVYVEPPLSVILAQNRERKTPVPENVILKLADKLDPPSITEAHGLTMDQGLG